MTSHASQQGLLAMKILFCLICLAIISSSVYAQHAELPARRPEDNFFIPARQPQSGHESRYQRQATPRQLVHRNAALRAAQRRERMATNARFGYSPSRPPSSTVPFMGSPVTPLMVYGVYAAYPGTVFPRPYARF